MFSRQHLKLGIRHLVFVGALIAVLSGCGPSPEVRKRAEAFRAFTGQYSNEKAERPAPSVRDWVVLDKAGRLVYRLNFSANCLITAKGLIGRVSESELNYFVTFSYRSVESGSNNEADTDCQNMTASITAVLNQKMNATIPKKSEHPGQELSALKPIKI